MKKIFLPTDFSKNAQKAIDYALCLFEKEACIFYLLHAYYIAPSARGTKIMAQEDLKQLIKTLEPNNNKNVIPKKSQRFFLFSINGFSNFS